MSVSEANLIELDLHPGYGELGLPAGVWRGTVKVAGDLSGGGMTGRLDFTAPVSQQAVYFSLEQFGVRVVGAPSSNVELNVDGFQHAQPDQDLVMSFQLQLIVPGISSVAMLTQTVSFLPLLLGRPRAGIQTSLRFVALNADADSLEVIAEGYRWDASAMGASGGVRRPLSGYYRA